jgi:hypothetical protein
VGSIQPSVRRIDDAQGCSDSPLYEEGNLRLRRPEASGGTRKGPSLGVIRPAQSSAGVQRPSPQTVVGSRRRPQAASRSSVGIRSRHLGACLHRIEGWQRRDCRGSQRSGSLFDRGESSRPKKRGEVRTQRSRSSGEHRRAGEANGENRVLEGRVRASEVELQKSSGASLAQRTACLCSVRNRGAHGGWGRGSSER